MGMTLAEFARHRGVARSTVTRWVQNGRMQLEPDGTVDPDAAARMLDATESPEPHHQARKAQLDEQRQRVAAGVSRVTAGADAAPARAAAAEHGQQDLPITEVPAGVELGLSLKSASVDLQRAKAEREALEVDKLAGTLMAREAVDFVLEDFGAAFRNLCESIPDRYTSVFLALAGDAPGIHRALQELTQEMAAQIADEMARRAEELAR